MQSIRFQLIVVLLLRVSTFAGASSPISAPADEPLPLLKDTERAYVLGMASADSQEKVVAAGVARFGVLSPELFGVELCDPSKRGTESEWLDSYEATYASATSPIPLVDRLCAAILRDDEKEINRVATEGIAGSRSERDGAVSLLAVARSPLVRNPLPESTREWLVNAMEASGNEREALRSEIEQAITILGLATPADGSFSMWDANVHKATLGPMIHLGTETDPELAEEFLKWPELLPLFSVTASSLKDLKPYEQILADSLEILLAKHDLDAVQADALYEIAAQCKDLPRVQAVLKSQLLRDKNDDLMQQKAKLISLIELSDTGNAAVLKVERDQIKRLAKSLREQAEALEKLAEQ